MKIELLIHFTAPAFLLLHILMMMMMENTCLLESDFTRWGI